MRDYTIYQNLVPLNLRAKLSIGRKQGQDCTRAGRTLFAAIRKNEILDENGQVTSIESFKFALDVYPGDNRGFLPVAPVPHK
jgi:hypothetical protein